MKIEDNTDSKINGREKGMGTVVITCYNTPPALQFTERTLNEISTFVQRFVERKGCISDFPRGYVNRRPPRL